MQVRISAQRYKSQWSIRLIENGEETEAKKKTAEVSKNANSAARSKQRPN